MIEMPLLVLVVDLIAFYYKYINLNVLALYTKLQPIAKDFGAGSFDEGN